MSDKTDRQPPREADRQRKREKDSAVGGKTAKLHKAKVEKNDEFYTLRSDIDAEMQHHADGFRGKRIYCNTDDPAASEFYRYFRDRYADLELRKLTATGYCVAPGAFGQPVGVEYDGSSERKLDLFTGDFRSMECESLLREHDVVVTNPPFTLFCEHVNMSLRSGKEFIIVGSLNGVSYTDIWPQIRDNKMWAGARLHDGFRTPGNVINKSVSARWYSNMQAAMRNKPIELCATYNPKQNPKYDNLDAINVEKTMAIPVDYAGTMGVPISFLDRYCPAQFQLVSVTNHEPATVTLKGKSVYTRILIKNRGVDLDESLDLFMANGRNLMRQLRDQGTPDGRLREILGGLL